MNKGIIQIHVVTVIATPVGFEPGTLALNKFNAPTSAAKNRFTDTVDGGCTYMYIH